MANEATPYADPADVTTCRVSATVTGKHFVTITGPKIDGLTQVGPAGDGDPVYGVAVRDKATGADVMVAHVGVWPVVAGANLSSGDAVQSGAAGVAIPLAAGVKAGTVVDDVVNGADSPVRLLV